MSVYTTVNKTELLSLIEKYSIGELSDFHGIEDGIENTTYFLTTQTGNEQKKWVLTVFETLTKQAIQPFVNLLSFLDAANFPVPNPAIDKLGQSLQTISNKPALILSRLHGSHLIEPNPIQCHNIGKVLASMHKHLLLFTEPMPRGLDIKQLQTDRSSWVLNLPVGEQQLMQSAIKVCEESMAQFQDLPEGIIHGDLFRDNVLFENDTPSGLIDFYSASHNTLLMDIAIVLNDWCVDDKGELNQNKTDAFIKGYHQERNISPAEHKALPLFLLFTGLQFWTLRLNKHHTHHQNNNVSLDTKSLIKYKDPKVYRDIVALRLASLSNA